MLAWRKLKDFVPGRGGYAAFEEGRVPHPVLEHFAAKWIRFAIDTAAQQGRELISIQVEPLQPGHGVEPPWLTRGRPRLWQTEPISRGLKKSLPEEERQGKVDEVHVREKHLILSLPVRARAQRSHR